MSGGSLVRTVGDGRMIKCSGPLYLDQGIAVTSHASQGKTVDQVIVSVFRIWKPEIRKRLFDD
jgi:hypothetical protein